MSDSASTAFESRYVVKTAAGPRLRPRVFVGLAALALSAGLFYLIDRQTDSWLGVPVILGYVAFNAVMESTTIRRHFRAARQGEAIAAKTRRTPADLLLYSTAFAVLVGSCVVNHWQRTNELAHREVVDGLIEIALGPGGSVKRDHHGKLQLTVQDPTFDDQRLIEVANLLKEDNPLLGVSRLILSPSPITQAWPGVTDESVSTLLTWKSLRLLRINGAAISEAGALRLATLPELRDFSISTIDYGPEAIDSLDRKFPSLRTWREIEAATKSPPPPVDESPLPPILG